MSVLLLPYSPPTAEFEYETPHKVLYDTYNVLIALKAVAKRVVRTPVHLERMRGDFTLHKRLASLSICAQEARYEELAEEAWNNTWTMLHDTDDWRLDKGTDFNSGTVHSKQYKSIGRVSKLQVTARLTSQTANVHVYFMLA